MSTKVVEAEIQMHSTDSHKLMYLGEELDTWHGIVTFPVACNHQESLTKAVIHRLIRSATKAPKNVKFEIIKYEIRDD